MLRVLDAAGVRSWCEAGRTALAAARDEIDDLNVFPVPDGDTGTNLLVTVESVVAAVRAEAGDLPAVARAMAHGALTGARGNSGVILSQLLRGLAEVLAAGPAGPGALARGLARSADLAYGAVTAPLEGTLLTVARAAGAAAGAAVDADPGADLAAVVAAARAGAQEALARTPQQLAALRAAGVVDAGGRGWVVLLEALEAVVSGRASVAVPPPHVPRHRSGHGAVRESGSDAYAYEVQYLLRDTGNEAVRLLREVLADLGDSLVVVGADGLFNVHVHVNDVGAALEAGIDAGRPFRVTVTRFAEQVAAGPRDGDQPRPVEPTAVTQRPAGRAVVAVVTGAGLARLFCQAGARVVAGGPAAGPSTVELLAAVHATGAAQVALLPNHGDVRPVAEAAADLARASGVTVAVVPTCSVVQGLSALAVADAGRGFAADVAAMGEAAAATRCAEVVYAVREATTSAGICLPGDALGLLDGRVVLVGAGLEWVARGLLDRLGEGAELLTLVLGAGAPDGVGERLRAHAAARCPGVQVVVVDGGQPHAPLLLGAE